MPKGALRLVGRAMRASDAEVIANPRARSATLRVAERTEFPLNPSIRIEPDARWRS
jgi:16S rRNA (cytosine1402-N4)-methyltransferase